MAHRRRLITWRLLLLILVIAAGGFGVALRLVQVQIVDHGYYSAQAQDEHLHQTVIHSPRGAILDRNGYPLATTVSTFDVYIDPRVWLDDASALIGAAELAPLLNRQPGELINTVRATGQGDYLAAQQVDANTGLTILTDAPPGVKAVESSTRFHPDGDLASALLGFIGRDQTGLSGVEADYDRVLGGVAGLVYLEEDGLGNPIPFGRKAGQQPEAGGDITLTIDRYIQSLVENELAAQVKAHGATGGAIVVMDPKTGEILAMAGEPTYQLSKLNLDDPSQADLYRNRVATDLYEPGSVMKTITMAAAIDLGLVNPNTTYDDTGRAEIDGGAVIKNWDFSVHGITTMTQVLQYSLNTGAVWLSNVLGANRFYDYIQRFGFGQPAEVGVGGEPAGIVRTNKEDSWYPIDLATNSFGQGISVTPVQMISAVAALVNGGSLMRPYIVKEATGPDGHRVYQPVVVRRAVSEETSRTLVQMMEAVVAQPGHLAQVPGYRVGGKTGTTTFSDSSDTLASFVGFAPVQDPRFIMLVRIDAPKDNSLGGVVAAPIFRDLAPKILTYMGVAPEPALVRGNSAP